MLELGTDLLGQPIIHRSASFGDNSIRWTLTRTWASGPRALAIGCNPSNAGADREDGTTHWWNAWFYQAGFGGYDAMNLYPFITSSPRECRRIAEWEKSNDWWARDQLLYHNLPALVAAAKQAVQVFVCWGAIAWDDAFIDHVVEEIQSGEAPYPDLWCWGKTASGAPKHPMARGLHRIPRDQQPILWRAA